jgi:hypothetical protein
MDDRYDSYICPSCEALYAREDSKRSKINQNDGPARYEEEFGSMISCNTCEVQGNSWNMFECAKCGSAHHPLCATPGGEKVAANDVRFNQYECQKCIFKQVQIRANIMKKAQNKVTMSRWAIRIDERASRRRWHEALIIQKAKANIKDNYRSAHEISPLPEYEKGQLVWVVKETPRLMTINSWGPYEVDQIMDDHQYKMINYKNGIPTKPVSGRYLKPFRRGDTLDTYHQEYFSDS